MRGAVPPLPNTLSWRGAELKHRDNFTFYLIYAIFISMKLPVLLAITEDFTVHTPTRIHWP